MANGKKIKLSKQTQQIIVAFLILLVIVWFVKHQLQKSEQDDISSNTDSDGSPKASSKPSKPAWQKKYDALPSVGDDGLLKKGVKAKEVWALQYLYNTEISNKTGRSKIGVDGVFGKETEGAVKYVLEGKYNSTRLSNWRKWVKMSKAERAEYFKTKTTTPAYNPTPTVFIPNTAESTFVYNPYGY